MEFDYDAHATGMLNRYLDSLDSECENSPCFGCEHCAPEPDPDRFRDEDPNECEE